MDHSRRIALLLDCSQGFARGALRGIRAYATGRPGWVVRAGPPRLYLVKRVEEWRPHGIIAGLMVPQVAHALMRLPAPLVNTASVVPGLKVPTVDADPAAVGRMAAEYYLERKFERFAYYGSASTWYSQENERAFRSRLAGEGYPVSSCHSDFLPDVKAAALWKQSSQKTVRWLRRLAKPVAVLADEDAAARYLADVCRQLGLRIPDDVSLLGVGNDELSCRLTPPWLSSIEVPAEQIGFEAAALLDRLMAGQAAPRGPVYLPPLRVITRHSTDITAVEDEMVQAALRHIRQHVREPLRTADVADAVAVARCSLERRFRRLLGRSVLKEIHRARTELAANLLDETDLSISAVARQAGFPSARQLNVVFTRLKGITPTAYRRQARSRRHPASME